MSQPFSLQEIFVTLQFENFKQKKKKKKNYINFLFEKSLFVYRFLSTFYIELWKKIEFLY